MQSAPVQTPKPTTDRAQRGLVPVYSSLFFALFSTGIPRNYNKSQGSSASWPLDPEKSQGHAAPLLKQPGAQDVNDYVVT